jgi:predicted dehydrogenase
MTDRPTLGIGIVGAGTMAAAHCLALRLVGPLFPELPVVPRVIAVADVNERLASKLAERYEIERVEPDWQRLLEADDVDLVVVCLPPIANREVVLGAAAAGKHIVCEKPLAETAERAQDLLDACRAAGVFHGLGAGYRWAPALRAIRAMLDRGELGEVRSLRASFMLDYGADPDVPLLWRFQRSLSGGGLAIDTGYHLVDCARYLVGEIDTVQSLTRTFITERPLPDADAIGNRGGEAGDGATRPLAAVDVEDAAAFLVTFPTGAYGVLETSRVAIGKRVALEIDVFGSEGSAAWDLERPDEFRVCLPGELSTFGYRRVLVNASHPGAVLAAGTDGTSFGWLGQQVAMWAEFLSAIGEGRSAHADFEDGVRINAVIDAVYSSAETGARTPVVFPGRLDPTMQAASA